MISQNNTTLCSPKLLSYTDKPLVNRSGFELPGITGESQKAVLELLEKNNQSFNIFFNELGYHNHGAHHFLAAYSCGATPALLKRIYDKNASYQRAKLPSQVTITRENWTQYLGRNDLWTDYLKFFEDIVKEEGMEKAVNQYAFHPKMFSRMFAGVVHPIIHLGYGIEFQLPIIIAEGLAMAAVHEDDFGKLLTEDLWAPRQAETKKVIDIVDEVGRDQRFDNVCSPRAKGNLEKLLNEKLDVVKEVAKQWTFAETEEGISEAARELYDASAVIYGATGIIPGQEKTAIHFYLMHGLTSILLIYATLPYLDLEKRRMLLKAHLAVLLAIYIAAGRPKLHIDALLAYVPKKLKEEPNPWLDVIEASLLEEEDAHVIKVIRSLLKAQKEWGAERKDNIYLKIAQLTYEGYKSYDWSFVGFD